MYAFALPLSCLIKRRFSELCMLTSWPLLSHNTLPLSCLIKRRFSELWMLTSWPLLSYNWTAVQLFWSQTALSWLCTVCRKARLSLLCTFFSQQATGCSSFLLEPKSKCYLVELRNECCKISCRSVAKSPVGSPVGVLQNLLCCKISCRTSNFRRELTLSQMYVCVYSSV